PGLSALERLPRLTSLDLGGTRLDDASAPLLAKLGQLSWLSLASTRITDAGLAHLPHSLRTLYLTRDTVTDAGMTVLLQLPRLRELDLRGTGVSAGTQALLEREHGLRLKQPQP
ncbi:MAG TPA: hypothetical protein VEU33_35475, partial [Archangium sp.]|nr:hypothetical protein [Archangium sp.]